MTSANDAVPPGTRLTEAEQAIVEANMGLVYRVVYGGRPTSQDLDRAQAGMLGLMRAAQKFRTDRGAEFSTYATYYIRIAVQRERMREHIVYVPAYLHSSGGWYDESNPKHRSLARKAKEAMSTCSLDSLRSEFDRPSEVGVVNDPGARIEREEDAEALRRRIEKALDSLNERDRDVVISRLCDGDTLETIARRIGVTREGVRKIEIRAIGTLRLHLIGYYAEGA